MTEDTRQPILSHLAELRSRIIKSVIALVVASIVAFIFREWILDLLKAPYEGELIALKPTEGFSAAMRLSFFGGMVLASPIVLYQIWAFVNPALEPHERKWTLPIVSALTVLFLAGVVFAYWILPRGLEFLQSVLDVRFQLTVGDYLKFVVRFLLVFAISFEFPVFLFALAAAHIVSSARLASGRRWAAVIIVTVAAVVTPTGDPYTLLMLSVPLYLMYEITIWLVRWTLEK